MPDETKGKDINIIAKKWDLEIKVKNKTILKGKLSYPIDVPNDIDLPDAVAGVGNGKTVELDWELKTGINSAADNGQDKKIRILCLTLVKKAPSKEITVWWQNVFNDHKGGNVSLDEMPDRATASQSVHIVCLF